MASRPNRSESRSGSPSSPVLNPYLRDDTPYLIPTLSSSVCYGVRRYIGPRPPPSMERKYSHRVLFRDDYFTCDGVNYRKVNDPANAQFLECLKERKCPDEFVGDGIHRIWIQRRVVNKGWDLSGERFEGWLDSLQRYKPNSGRACDDIDMS